MLRVQLQACQLEEQSELRWQRKGLPAERCVEDLIGSRLRLSYNMIMRAGEVGRRECAVAERGESAAARLQCAPGP